MRKAFLYGLSLAMLLSLAACHKPQAGQQDTSQPDPATTSTSADVSSPEPVKDTPDTEPPVTPAPEPVKDTAPEPEAPEVSIPEPPADPAPVVEPKPEPKPEQPPVTPVKKDTPKPAEETTAPEPPAEQTPPAPAETEEQQTSKPSGGQQPTGDTQGLTSVYDPWNPDYSNVVVDTRTEEQKQADIKMNQEASEGLRGTIQAGGLG